MAVGARIRVGADVGGTFTDLMMADDAGRVWAHKVPSTPPHFEQAVLKGIEHLLLNEAGEGATVAQVAHGTTVATNAVLEHRGARTALITTRGFRDVLELRRIRSPELYNLSFRKPKSLIERYLRFELTERVTAEGEVLSSPADSELFDIKEKLLQEKIESVAVCLLHSYAYPDHEKRVGDFLREHLPGIDVSLSSEVLRERKEYERTATTAVNAYVQPVMRGYLNSLRAGLSSMGIGGPLFIMQSSGGLTPEQDASVRPVYVLESGPAAGVLAAEQRARVLGLKNIITFDMGGTTAKASLIENGRVSYSAEYEVGASLSAGNRLVGGAGDLIRAPSIDIAEVGAGGGSIASVDKAGGLHVGPRSAGAVPGPACYQLGGTEPTITDADVVLGYIRTGKIADGRVCIDIEAARKAIHDKVAQPLGLDLLAAAEGIHRVANARMMRALRAVSTQRGRDPRDFTMLGFGGCGPIHAALLADELAVRRTIIPPLPGLFSAIGLLSSPVEHHDVRSCMIRGTRLPVDSLRQIHDELRQRMLAQFRGEGIAPHHVSFVLSADIRFQGQSSEVRINFEEERVDEQSLVTLRDNFDREYKRLYGHLADADNPLEIVAMRLIGRATSPEACTIRPVEAADRSNSTRSAYFGTAWGSIDTPVIDRRSLVGRVRGPLLIEEYDSTTVVPPFMEAYLDDHFDIILESRNV
jgi:N-methylhydantoinase A/oxoprolinase/acetone carboxylase beta subunit